MSDEALQDVALRALLRRLHASLRLSCGSLRSIGDERGPGALRGLLAEVMPLLLRVTLPPGEEDGRRLIDEYAALVAGCWRDFAAADC